MSRLALVESLLEERYGPRPGNDVVASITRHAPPVQQHGPNAVCRTRGCHNLASLAIEVPFRGTRRACGIHIDDALDALGVTGTTEARITRIAP